MLALRFIANMFRWESFTSLLASKYEEVLDKLADFAQSDNKNVRLALVTVLLNFSILFMNKHISEGKMQCMSIISEVLGHCTDQDAEIVYRGFAALGTLVWNDDQAKQNSKDLELNQFYGSGKLLSGGKVTECSQELRNYIV